MSRSKINERLFQPLKVGNVQLNHRVMLAPMTRYRATENHVPGPHAAEYYAQRASARGTLIITEAAFISPAAGGMSYVPGIWNEEQIAAWKVITDVVHEKGSFIFLQLWALGRAAGEKSQFSEATGYPIMAPSPLSVGGKEPLPQEMTDEDVLSFIRAYADGARNAMQAGFDGVELHGANGYLIDQFIQDVTNKRTDRWGGSVENRARFGLEITKAIIDAVGDPNKVGFRLSPWSKGKEMGMSDPVPQFSYMVEELKKLGIAYLHIIEARTSGTSGADAVYPQFTRENDLFVKLWCEDNEAPIILSGGYDLKKARRVLEELYPSRNVAISFGRLFLSTPDLPCRFKHGLEPNAYNRPTFYEPRTEVGFTDYPRLPWTEYASVSS